MPTTTPLTDAIQALTTYANETTRASDTTLSAAVGTLVAGYGQGGGWTTDGIVSGTEPNGAITIGQSAGTSIRNYAFQNYTGITSVSAPYITSLGESSFQGCTGLVSIDMPLVNWANSNNTFRSCSSLVVVDLPELNILGQSAFRDCTSLRKFRAANFSNSGNRSMQNDFYGCTSLEIADLGNIYALNSELFRNCSSLKTIILRRSTISTLGNVNVFTDTPFASGGSGGTIYVPSALKTTYQTATNWSTYHSYGTITWENLEGSIYESKEWDMTSQI